MSTKSETITEQKTEIVEDDLSKEDITVTEEELDAQKLATLKNKMAASKGGDGVTPKIVEPKRRSIRIGVVGSGQAGSRLAECFYALGYPAVAMNTAMQDLEHINLPEDNKLFLEYGLGGASKELGIGQEAAETHRAKINELIHEKLGESQVFIFSTSLGGGSGAGSVETIIDILASYGAPVVVLTVLPLTNDDASTKNNALETLSRLSKAVQAKRISNLIVVDNAKIETIYANVSQMDFYPVSNRAIVEPIDVFNTLSSAASPVKSLDPTEWAKILADGEGLTVYGRLDVPNYEEDTAIAEAVVNNLNSNLLAAGFDLKKAKYVGAMFVAPKEVWDKVPSASINYAMALINDVCDNPAGVFRGVYEVPSDDKIVKVYSVYSGLGLPEDRIESLKLDVKELLKTSKTKDEKRNLALKLDTGTEETVSAADKVRDKIKQKSSAFGRLTKGAVVDRRKK